MYQAIPMKRFHCPQRTGVLCYGLVMGLGPLAGSLPLVHLLLMDSAGDLLHKTLDAIWMQITHFGVLIYKRSPLHSSTL